MFTHIYAIDLSILKVQEEIHESPLWQIPTSEQAIWWQKPNMGKVGTYSEHGT